LIRNIIEDKHIAAPAMMNASVLSAVMASIQLTPHMIVRSRLNKFCIINLLRG
jgi:hypothetical protein